MNQNGNFQPKGMQNLAHAFFQIRRRMEKASNPVIGISFKYIDAAQLLSTIPKFSDVYWTGGVKKIDRGRRY